MKAKGGEISNKDMKNPMQPKGLVQRNEEFWRSCCFNRVQVAGSTVKRMKNGKRATNDFFFKLQCFFVFVFEKFNSHNILKMILKMFYM